MKINLNEPEDLDDNKCSKKPKPSILLTTWDLFSYYIKNNYTKFTSKIHSIYSFKPDLENIKINSNKNMNSNSFKDISINSDIVNENLINNNNEASESNELLIFNNIQIKKNIYLFLENELKINNTKIDLRNCNNQNLQIKKYKEFKNKTIIYFFSSIIILKYYNIISITSLCVISLMKKIKVGNIYSNIIINNNQIKSLLDTLWDISSQTSKNIFSSVSEIIYNYVDKIQLNEKYNKDKFTNLFKSINNEIRNKCNYFIHIIKVLRENINNLENKYFDILSTQKNNLDEYKLRFFYILCDIICSNVFFSTFVQSYEKEIELQIEEIKTNFGEKNEKTILAIISDIDSHKTKKIAINENNGNKNSNELENNNRNNKDEILMNYQNCLQSIAL